MALVQHLFCSFAPTIQCSSKPYQKYVNLYMQNKMEVHLLLYSMNIIINCIVKLKAFKYEYFTSFNLQILKYAGEKYCVL